MTLLFNSWLLATPCRVTPGQGGPGPATPSQPARAVLDRGRLETKKRAQTTRSAQRRRTSLPVAKSPLRTDRDQPSAEQSLGASRARLGLSVMEEELAMQRAELQQREMRRIHTLQARLWDGPWEPAPVSPRSCSLAGAGQAPASCLLLQLHALLGTQAAMSAAGPSTKELGGWRQAGADLFGDIHV